MPKRIRAALTTRPVPRLAILGLLASLTALAPAGPLTGVASATTGHIDEYRPPGLTQGTASSDPLGITTGPDGNLWYTDAGENLSANAPAPAMQAGRFNPGNSALDLYGNGERGSIPAAVTTGPDGNLWFADVGASANDVWALTPQGTVPAGYPSQFGIKNPPGVAPPLAGPSGIVTGPDNKVWFTEFGAGALGRIDPHGGACDSSKTDPCETDFHLPGGLASPTATTTVTDQPLGLTADRTRNLLWATVQGSQQIIAMDTNGVVVHQIPTGLPNLAGITMGPDGNVWFTQENAPNPSVIGRIDPATGTELPRFNAPGANANPSAITAGPDGNLWYIDQGTNTVVRVTTAGIFTPFSVPTANAFSGNVQPTGITAGPCDSIWFTENHTSNSSAPAISRLTIDTPLQLSPCPVSFGTHVLNSASNQSVALTNTSGLPITINSTMLSGSNPGDYAILPATCPAVLTSQASCNLTIQFKPSAAGTRPAFLVVNSSDSPRPHMVPLSGVGAAAQPSLTPSSVSFGGQAVGSPSKPVNFTLSNITGLPVSVSSATISGANPGDFTVKADTCSGKTVPDNSSCAVSVAFAPTTLGARSASLAVASNGAGSPQTATMSGTGIPAGASTAGGGYWLAASDGGIFSYGSAAFKGSAGSIRLNKPVVGMARTATGNGYWLVASDGGIFNYGDAGFFGSAGSLRLNKPIVGMAAAPDGKGYWLVASDGGIFSYGSAGFFGSAGSLRLNKPMVGMAGTPDGKGYWLVASDGGIFNYGDAGFFGSAGSIALNKPVVGMAATADGGYWLVATDGGIFNYGDAVFRGSAGSIALNKPVVGMAATATGGGYWLVATDGGIFNYGDAPFRGSAGSIRLNKPIVGMAPSP
jgi:streptogramin lyase